MCQRKQYINQALNLKARANNLHWPQHDARLSGTAMIAGML
jgi:hypothetical protein